MKSFETWLVEDVENSFDIKKTKNNLLFSEWLNNEVIISDEQKKQLDVLAEELADYVDTWNEDELKFHFISPLMHMVRFISEHFKSFTQRNLPATVNGIELGGRVDMMVATGKARPKHPFFFFNEYKPSKRGINDPLGQLLIEMVAAQYLNADTTPIYGAYTEGRFWYFVILDQRQYAVSNPYDAATEGIYKVFAILCKAKDYINQWFEKK